MLGLPEIIQVALISGIVTLTGIFLKTWLDRSQERAKARAAQTYPKAVDVLGNLHSNLVAAYESLLLFSATNIEERTTHDAVDKMNSTMDAFATWSLRSELYLDKKTYSTIQRAEATFWTATNIVLSVYSEQLERRAKSLSDRNAALASKNQEERASTIDYWKHLQDLRSAVREVEIETGKKIEIPNIPDWLKDMSERVSSLKQEIEIEEMQTEQATTHEEIDEENALTSHRRNTMSDKYRSLRQSFDWDDVTKHYGSAVSALAPFLKP